MDQQHLEALFAAPSPFDDAFSSDLLSLGDMVNHFPVWTQCGRRIDLHARSFGWHTLTLWSAMEDAEATFNGRDDDCWESSSETIAAGSVEVWINWRARRPACGPQHNADSQP